jgi:site-specific DNA-methyltransferase (cytosine-N4-specific)
MNESDLPFGSEFSPSQISLRQVLELAETHNGDWKSFEDAVYKTYFANYSTSEYNKRKLANNTKLGMIAYGILDREGNLTQFGQDLLRIKNNEIKLYDTLTRHILVNLNGMSMVQCIQDMVAAGEQVNLTTLRENLAIRGIRYPSGGKHPSIMRLWLAKSGVFVGDRWQIDEVRLNEVLGIASVEFDVLAAFSPEQRAFLRALANTGTTEPQPANEIARLGLVTYGVKFPEKSLPKLVLNDLEKAGYIITRKTTSGRGAKPFLVAPTEKLLADVVIPLLDQLEHQTDPALREMLKKPMSAILEELVASDRATSGLALEALGFKLMRLLDMDYVTTRLRGRATGGAEVDLIFESKRLVYSRWQVQCKNTERGISLDDVAKEVGLTHMLKSNAIIMISTGEIGREARRYANKVMADSNLAIVMLDRSDLERIARRAVSIVDSFEREARHAMRLKTLDLES